MPPSNGTPITLADGKERVLRYDWQSLEAAETILGASGVYDIGVRLDRMHMRTISTLVWLGLQHASPKLTRDEVVKNLDTRELNDLSRAITDALKLAMPEKRVGDDDGGEGEDGGTAGAAV